MAALNHETTFPNIRFQHVSLHPMGTEVGTAASFADTDPSFLRFSQVLAPKSALTGTTYQRRLESKLMESAT